jgi:acetolactate synthase-1/2/3 large subunit
VEFEKKSNEIYPVLFLKKFFKKLKKNSLIFSDAGATLSWSYQAANNVEKCPSIFTSFNLHSMGYANCASVGAAVENKKEIFCIIGDGSVPMNSQELSWLKKYKVKIIILDNKGYGIIRQTQRQFYKSNFIGSDFKNRKASMPSFDVKSILESFDIPLREVRNNKSDEKNISWLLNRKTSCALIVSIDYKHQVIT